MILQVTVELREVNEGFFEKNDDSGLRQVFEGEHTSNHTYYCWICLLFDAEEKSDDQKSSDPNWW